MNKKVTSVTDGSCAIMPPILDPIFSIKTFSGPISPLSKLLGFPPKKEIKKPPRTPPPPAPKITISRETKHRLINDIKDLIKNPLTSHGIYYIHEVLCYGYLLNLSFLKELCILQEIFLNCENLNKRKTSLIMHK